MLKFFLYFLTMSEDVRIGLIVFFVVNRLIASAVSALMARRRGRTPWKWALTSLLLGWIGFITVCVSKNITEEETDNLGDSTLTTAIFLSIILTWATWSYVDRIGLMPWIDTVEDFKDIFRGEPKEKGHDWLDYNVDTPRKTETPEQKRNREEWHELWDEVRRAAAKDAERVREGMKEAERRAEARKVSQPEKEDGDEAMIREIMNDYIAETSETEGDFDAPSVYERKVRKYKKEIAEVMGIYRLSAPCAADLILYCANPNHQDRYYYHPDELRTIMNYIDLKTGKQYVNVDSMPVEYMYDIITVNGKRCTVDELTGDTLWITFDNVRYW